MIRAALHAVWPDLSLFFGLHPWDAGRLAVAEWNRYVDARDELVRAQRKGRH